MNIRNPSLHSRLIVAHLAASTFASPALAGNLPDSWTIIAPTPNPTGGEHRFVFRQPAPVQCMSLDCINLTNIVKPPAGPAPTAVEIASAEVALDQAWKIANAYNGPTDDNLTVVGQGAWHMSTLQDSYILSFRTRNVLDTTDDQGHVLTRTSNWGITVARAGYSVAVCTAIDAKGMPGMTCSGGTLTVVANINSVKVFAQNGVFRDPTYQPPFVATNTQTVPVYNVYRSLVPGAAGFGSEIISGF